MEQTFTSKNKMGTKYWEEQNSKDAHWILNKFKHQKLMQLKCQDHVSVSKYFIFNQEPGI